MLDAAPTVALFVAGIVLGMFVDRFILWPAAVIVAVLDEHARNRLGGRDK